MFLEGSLLVDEEDLLPVPTIVVNRFNVLRMINELKTGADLDHLRTPARRRSIWKFRKTLRSHQESPSPAKQRSMDNGSDGVVRSKSVGGTPNISPEMPTTNFDANQSPALLSPDSSAIGGDPFSDDPGSPDRLAPDPAAPNGTSASKLESPRFAISPMVEGRIRCTSTELWSIADAADKYDGFILDQCMYARPSRGGGDCPSGVTKLTDALFQSSAA